MFRAPVRARRSPDMQYLIDASVYVFRAHYSMPEDMVDDAGNPINALYGFCRFIGDFMEQVTPEYVAVLFDESLSKSFRTEIYPAYKANRDPAPPELKRQFGQCRRFVRALGIMEHASPRYEADDLIGTLVEHGRLAVIRAVACVVPAGFKECVEGVGLALGFTSAARTGDEAPCRMEFQRTLAGRQPLHIHGKLDR